jgi:hypothetical protein
LRERFAITLLLLALATGGCTAVGVEFAEDEDFSGYRTWAWLPRLEPPDDPFAEEADVLALELERQTEAALARRGFERIEEGEADFYVTYHLELTKEIVYSNETQPEQLVSSLNEGPSYAVTGSKKRKRVYERGHLVIDVADGEDRQLVWRGTTESKYRGSWKPHARAAVFGILDHFPPEADTARAEAEDGAGS